MRPWRGRPSTPPFHPHQAPRCPQGAGTAPKRQVWSPRSSPSCVSLWVLQFPFLRATSLGTPKHTNEGTANRWPLVQNASPQLQRRPFWGRVCWHTWSSRHSSAALLFDASIVPLPPNSLTYINFGIYCLAASTSTNLCMAGSCGRDPPGHVISFSLLLLKLLVTQWGFSAAVKKLLEICYKWILSVL